MTDWTGVPPIDDHHYKYGRWVSLATSGRRTFWVARCRSSDNTEDFVVDIAHGWADTPLLAMQAGREALGDGNAPRGRAGYASWSLRLINAERAAARTPAENGAARLELVYQSSISRYADGGRWIPHRIVKRTSRFIYIDQEHWWPDRQWTSSLATQLADLRCYRLDRDALERGEEVYVRLSRAYAIGFVLDPEQYDRQHAGHRDLPDCLLRLGFVRHNVTGADVKGAYRRLSKRFHPDAGGTDEQFKVLQTAYEEALRLVRTTAQANGSMPRQATE